MNASIVYTSLYYFIQPLVNSANLKCPRLMAILEMDLGTTVEDKDQESEKMSRKRDRSSSIELSEERAPKTFRKCIIISTTACMHYAVA